ncbi:hypothetical protein BO221_35900 [Archangium sp. Cb G35]|uniref:hypothetical protein n=1 Tax=Archangium sp. Cb G35 TaxID=1920190 RepID=UPI000937D69F|nr:hypothetical protein [Archangium sp. Cb G35]OJT19728.1 hypothetical protein BO221_35900 [Archangium sp. Cb G35]
MRKLLLVMALGATGCVAPHAQYASTNLERQAPFGVVELDSSHRYIIDPRTESCFLRVAGANSNFALVPVSCAKLKKNVPEAVAYITWEPSDAATP